MNQIVHSHLLSVIPRRADDEESLKCSNRFGQLWDPSLRSGWPPLDRYLPFGKTQKSWRR